MSLLNLLAQAAMRETTRASNSLRALEELKLADCAELEIPVFFSNGEEYVMTSHDNKGYCWAHATKVAHSSKMFKRKAAQIHSRQFCPQTEWAQKTENKLPEELRHQESLVYCL